LSSHTPSMPHWCLPLEKSPRLPPHLERLPKPEADVKPEDLTADDVLNIQEKWVPVNEHYRNHFVVRLKRENFEKIPENETEMERLERIIKQDPILTLDEDKAYELSDRLEMQEGTVQWFTPRRRIPFGPPQRFMVPKDDEETVLMQDRVPEELTDLPIPPDPADEDTLKDMMRDRERAKKEAVATPAAA